MLQLPVDFSDNMRRLLGEEEYQALDLPVIPQEEE